MQSLVFFITVFILCSTCAAQVTTDPPGLVAIPENQADILLFTGTYKWQDVNCKMRTVDGSSKDNVLDLHISVTFVTVQGTCAFNVTLLTPVDYEKTKSFTVDVYLRMNCTGTESVQTIKKRVAVENLMDTAPAFTQSVYTASIPENQVVNTAVIINISASDADGTDSVTYAVNFVEQQSQVFEVRQQTNPEIIDVYLISPVDFEQQHTYRFTITAVDTVGMNSTCDVIIKVINIQDTPPYFTALQYNGRVREDADLGALVLSVSAVDGDSVLLQGEWDGTSANQIYYSIIAGGDGMFAVNSSTGEITTIKQLDIDNNTNVSNGLVVLTIMAEELNTSMEAQHGSNRSTVLVLVQVEDANDNRPQFSSQSFTGSIRAEALVGEFITLDGGGYISVQDIDQAPSNNRFCLHIEQNGQPWDVLKPNIEMQYAYASVMIQLNKNDSLTDLAATHIKFQIVAHECGHVLQNFPPTKSDITVWVKAYNVPTVTPEPIISLPLSTSDIIVFIVGLLLLLNIGLTLFICYAFRRGREYPMTFLNRNSKYRMTNREPYNKTASGEELGHLGVSKYMANEDHVATTNVIAVKIQEQTNPKNAQDNTASKIENTHHSDMTMLKDKTQMLSLDVNEIVFSKNTHVKNNASLKPLANDASASQMKPLETVTLNERRYFNSNGTTSKAYSESNKPETTNYATNQQNQRGTEMSNLGQGLSKFPQNSEQHLDEECNYGTNKKDETSDLHGTFSFESDHSLFRSNNSSDSENRSIDKLPLIKSSHDENENNYEHCLSATNGKINQPTTKNKNLSLLLDQSLSDHSIQESDKDKKVALSNIKHRNVDQQLLPIPDKDNAHFKTPPATSQSPVTAQLTQTGVPPIALALPYSTGTFSINKEPQTGVINPVFETHASSDDQQTVSFFPMPPEDGKL